MNPTNVWGQLTTLFTIPDKQNKYNCEGDHIIYYILIDSRQSKE